MNPEPTPSNRRELPRANAAYSIAYEFFNPGGVKIAEGNAATVNISGRGALIEIPIALDPNGSLILWITAPFYTMLFKGSIMHSRAASNGMFHIGVRLTDVIEGRWESLEELVQKQLEAAGQ